jgi:uroporphyrinogen-III synthase
MSPPPPYGTKVLLLREPSTPPTPDRYESAFLSAGYHPISLPVLETVHVNLPVLKDIICDGPKAHGFVGVVITSKRSCEAWAMALGILKEEGRHKGKDDDHDNENEESVSR